ncbi:hypothetical protein CPB83DRAFT_859575 [Crepidotus variabilis]|uniref:R3H domain-containing protein n=1 Tax=Crepidotus variabilis TaxID=179855 RepID=A0A9P6EAI0_9AGAR|nr:hypothetical protein CPB83DRAFT_859575 [Crepidotus variabilis]
MEASNTSNSTTGAISGSPMAEGGSSNNKPPRRRPQSRPNPPPGADSASGEPRQNSRHRGPRKRPHTLDNAPNSTSQLSGEAGSVNPSLSTGDVSKKRVRNRRPVSNPTNTDAPSNSGPPNARQEGSRRRANFGGGLTTQEEVRSTSDQKPSDRRRGKARPGLPEGDDLTSTLIRELSTPPYPDCPICFSSIRPEHAIWSCSPSIPIVVSNEAQVREYCWTAFHVRCIRSWADKSVKEVADAWRARGESDRKGDWRCPGCQAKRETVPAGYWCFCHSTAEPKPARLSTPHSCGSSCSRTRESGCGHACPMQCHPGPCPQCQITTRLSCYCPRKQEKVFRCGIDTRGKKRALRDLSCGNICARPLNCGKHQCQKMCHDGPCDDCDVMEVGRCLCGKEKREVRCGTGEQVESFVEGEPPWVGRFTCDQTCNRFFDCGKHTCQKPCHSPSSKPTICPRSPSQITHCPCGKHTVARQSSSDASQYDFPARTDCSDPIPTCTSTCSKPHPSCGHLCTGKCHTGPCPPCSVQIVRPCRCGATTRGLTCFMIHSDKNSPEEKEILCDKPCQALRACGRHQCRRVCCPLASLALGTGRKGKKRAQTSVEDSTGIGEEQGGLHECDLVCGKTLSCGNHRCEMKDHKGGCPPCLRSSFEELICACGRTVYEPPIPCGTRMECHYPCPLPRTICDHPNTSHACHDHDVPCPPCPHLTNKACACGKKIVTNVRCSLETEKVSCGTVCGKLMSCGFHHCERLCHGDECGACVAPCGKSRKSCLPNHHPCTEPCHAPSSCIESEPCQALVTIYCPCGRIKQSVSCGRTSSSGPASRVNQQMLKCTNDCQIAKRNARLAEALGINSEAREKTNAAVVYSDELCSFARLNGKFLPIVEKAFGDFVQSDKRTQVLPHMPLERRKFVHDLASVYRMDTQMVDQEPHRSVQLLRRLDTRIPAPLLSAHISMTGPAPGLGKLADLKNLRGPASSTSSGGVSLSTNSSSWRSASGGGAAPHAGAPAQRGWASVLAKPSPSSTPQMTPTRALTPLGGRAQAATTPVIRSASPIPRVVTPIPAATNIVQENIPDNWEDEV